MKICLECGWIGCKLNFEDPNDKSPDCCPNCLSGDIGDYKGKRVLFVENEQHRIWNLTRKTG